MRADDVACACSLKPMTLLYLWATRAGVSPPVPSSVKREAQPVARSGFEKWGLQSNPFLLSKDEKGKREQTATSPNAGFCRWGRQGRRNGRGSLPAGSSRKLVLAIVGGVVQPGSKVSHFQYLKTIQRQARFSTNSEMMDMPGNPKTER